ncbi:MAG: TatD family hydrolase [Saprospiraceae bacterium]
MLIDTHAHLYVKEFSNDRLEMVERAKAAGVSKIFLPNIDVDTIPQMKELVDLDRILYPMIGLHPCSVKSEFENDLKILKSELDTSTYYGIGETGIDLYWDKTTLDIQIAALKVQCDWALEYNLPIILHTRNATSVVIDLLEKLPARPSKGIFHCFGGTIDEINRINELGDYCFGIGGVITFKNGGLFEMIPHIPMEKLVLETDSPYLAPAPYRGKRNESSYLKLIVDKLAESLQLSVEGVTELTTSNANRIFTN